MFKHHCTSCDRTQLIFLSQVTAVNSAEQGASVTFTCWCGATQDSSFSLLSADPAPVSPDVRVAV